MPDNVVKTTCHPNPIHARYCYINFAVILFEEIFVYFWSRIRFPILPENYTPLPVTYLAPIGLSIFKANFLWSNFDFPPSFLYGNLDLFLGEILEN